LDYKYTIETGDFMSQFSPVPRGTPIDVSLLSRMSEYVWNINQTIQSLRTAKSSPWSTSRQTIDTDNMSIWTSKELIVSNSVPDPNATHVNWAVRFEGITFKSVPIVTVTPYCDTTGGGTIAPNVVWIHEITPTGVKGKFKWLGKTTKTENVYALIIAVGQGAVV
jgi:hypothetical protein